MFSKLSICTGGNMTLFYIFLSPVNVFAAAEPPAVVEDLGMCSFQLQYSKQWFLHVTFNVY